MQNDNGLTSEAPAIESAAPAPEASSVSEAPASGTSGEASKETLLDAVLQVVPATTEETVEGSTEDKEAPPASEDAEGKDQAEDDASKDENDDASDEEETENVSPTVRKKMNKLLKQRRELRAENAQLRAPAEIGAQLQNFAVSHQLGTDDVVNALHIAATLRRGDYSAFYQMIAPYVRHAQEYLGVVLPDDLQQAVHQGHMSDVAAREYAKTRFDQQRMQIENERMNDMGRQFVVGQVQQNVARAVSSFEERLAASDPDYKAKAGFVHRAASALLRERGGTISTVEEALALTKQAYDEVNANFRRMQPRRATPPTPGGTSNQAPTRAAPKSLMEAATQALLQSRTG